MMIERVYSGTGIRQRSDGWFCLTDMGKATGKLVGGWWRLGSTQDFVKALKNHLHGEHCADSHNAPAVIEIKPGGADPGSWAHPQLAHHFAMWCSPDFAVRVTGWVEEIRTTGFATGGALGGGTMERLLGAVVRILDRLEAIERRLDGRLGVMPYGQIAALPLGTTVREPGMLVVRLPSDEEYHTVRFELIRQHILVTDRGQRAKLGRLVAGRYRVEAQSHPDWPSSPILVDRAGNHYPPQTWEWLAEAVQRVAGEMGLLPGTAVHQASLWNGTGGPLDVSVTVP